MTTSNQLIDEKAPELSHAETRDLVPGNFGIRGSITHAVVIKEGDVFFLCEPDGGVPLERGHGFGLYYHDCRFLDGYELRVSGSKPDALVSNAEGGSTAMLGLSNRAMECEGQKLLKNDLEIRWSRRVSSDPHGLFDTIALHSFAAARIAFPLALRFRADFEDVFAIRGLFQGQRGTLHSPEWREKALHFLYEGADGLDRAVGIEFSPAPVAMQDGNVRFAIELEPRQSRQISVSISISEVPRTTRHKIDIVERGTGDPISSNGEIASLRRNTQLSTDSLLLNRVMDRSLRDLDVLRSQLTGVHYFAAGVPWFVALFGRDSIITALQTLAYDPGIAAQTLRLLARYQGKKIDPWREEEPGKILHELRVGEMARLGEVPHTPYFGTIDATPLWLVLMARHSRWTGDLQLFRELRPHIDAALDWIRRYGDTDGDGYLEYECKIEKGLANQGWKDSGDAIVNADGSLAVPPIALVEVQGYAYEAKIELASLFRRAGEDARAAALESEAHELRERFNRDFWVREGYYALALQKNKDQVAVLSSNGGHALWSGIAQPEFARQTAAHLLSPEMFNGWGIRTLSAAAVRYNPLGYHLGTVWPHDNSLIAAGFKRYGLDVAALRVLTGMLEAAVHFDAHRLPELFGGFCPDDYGVPVSYPVACQPQAWAAGAVPYLVMAILGLEPDAFSKRLAIVRPTLPENVHRAEIQGLRIGAAHVDLVFERRIEGVEVRVNSVDGELEVEVRQ
jgi:glycogen debranching enzyme